MDANKNIVTNPVNKGTYNHFNPGGLTSNLNHILLDVAPYFVKGNDATVLPNYDLVKDSSRAIDRIGRTFYNGEK